jgi:hypothetical protein
VLGQIGLDECRKGEAPRAMRMGDAAVEDEDASDW